MIYKGSSKPIRVIFKTRPLKFLFVATVLVSTLLLSTIYVSTEYEHEIIVYGNETRFDRLKAVFQKLRSLVVRNHQKYFPQKPQRILLWTSYFSKEDWLPSQLVDLGCTYNCLVTTNRSLFNDSDAVVFHLRNVQESDLPHRANERQRWVLFNKEAPPHTPVSSIQALEDKIHWTATYRRDSDIYAPYGRIIKRTSTHATGPRRSKKRMVCWLVSNCVTPSKREEYVSVLKRYIPVYTFGKCGKIPCPTTNVYECYTKLSNSCKFYLSFENSLCTDYVTEKVFNALRTDMVPIVMGGSDYKKLLPNHSYINALDYKNPKDLAAFLFELSDDDDKYDAYFEWKKEYEVQDMAYKWTCELCRMLHESDSLVTKKYMDLAAWWFGKAICFSWYEYFSFY